MGTNWSESQQKGSWPLSDRAVMTMLSLHFILPEFPFHLFIRRKKEQVRKGLKISDSNEFYKT